MIEFIETISNTLDNMSSKVLDDNNCHRCQKNKISVIRPSIGALPERLISVQKDAISKLIERDNLCEFCIDLAIDSTMFTTHTWGKKIVFSEKELGITGCKYKIAIDNPKKIILACEYAIKCNYAFVWMDAICINQENLQEVERHVQNMSRYYANCRGCVGVSGDTLTNMLKEWTKRVWTLQESILPRKLGFSTIDIEINNIDITSYTIENSHYSKLFKEVQKMRTDFRKSKFSTAEALEIVSQRYSYYEHDRIYGIMGLISRDNEIYVSYNENPVITMRRFIFASSARGDHSWMQLSNQNNQLNGHCFEPCITGKLTISGDEIISNSTPFEIQYNLSPKQKDNDDLQVLPNFKNTINKAIKIKGYLLTTTELKPHNKTNICKIIVSDLILSIHVNFFINNNRKLLITQARSDKSVIILLVTEYDKFLHKEDCIIGKIEKEGFINMQDYYIGI